MFWGGGCLGLGSKIYFIIIVVIFFSLIYGNSNYFKGYIFYFIFPKFVEMRMNGDQRDVQSESTFGPFYIRPLVKNT